MVRTTTSRGSSVPPTAAAPSEPAAPISSKGVCACASDWPASDASGRSTRRRSAASSDVDEVVVSDLDADAARALSRAARRRLRRLAGRDARPGGRRLRHRHGHSGPRAAAAPRHRGRRADLLREAGRRHARGDARARQARGASATSPCTSASSAASTAATSARAQAVAAASSASCTRIRAQTHDQAPPHAAYIPTSGGLFRDCSIHDFDIIRFVTGREVASVYATGANKGADFFSEAGDVDTAAAVLTLDDGTLVLGLGDALQRSRPRRAHGGARQRGHARGGLRRVARRHLGRGRRRPTRPVPDTGPSWSASCRPTVPS